MYAIRQLLNKDKNESGRQIFDNLTQNGVHLLNIGPISSLEQQADNKIIVTIHVMNQSLDNLTLSLAQFNRSSCSGTFLEKILLSSMELACTTPPTGVFIF